MTQQSSSLLCFFISLIENFFGYGIFFIFAACSFSLAILLFSHLAAIRAAAAAIKSTSGSSSSSSTTFFYSFTGLTGTVFETTFLSFLFISAIGLS